MSVLSKSCLLYCCCSGFSGNTDKVYTQCTPLCLFTISRKNNELFLLDYTWMNNIQCQSTKNWMVSIFLILKLAKQESIKKFHFQTLTENFPNLEIPICNSRIVFKIKLLLKFTIKHSFQNNIF